MANLFEFAIFNELKTETTFNVFYGTAEEASNKNHIIQNKIAKNDDTKLPCDEFGKAGDITLQWTIYAVDWLKLDKITDELNAFLYSLKEITFEGQRYIINTRLTNGISNNNIIEGGLTFSNLTMTFEYVKE